MWLCLLLSLILLQGAVSQWSNTIYVSNTGSNSPSCLRNGSSDNACQTLEYATSGMANSTRIMLLEGSYELNTTIHLSSYSDIAITGVGMAENQQIECSNGSSSGGLYFEGIENLYVGNLTFVQCGSLLNGTSWNTSTKTNLFRSAMYVLNCTDVRVESALFTSGLGRGLVLFDTNGLVSIVDSNFTSNMVPKKERSVYPGGGGLYIEHTYCTPGRTSDCDFDGNPYSNNSVYDIRNCWFTSNEASVIDDVWHNLKGANVITFNKGGGLFVLLKGKSAHNTFLISNCHFLDNAADFGGGLALYLQDFASNNSFQVSNISLRDNIAHKGGGGVIVGYASVGCDCLSENSVTLQSCTYLFNTASWGGGLYFYASRASTATAASDTLTMSDSKWYFNSAVTGAAVQLVPEAWSTLTDGYLPVPVFKDCQFEANILTEPRFGVSQSIVSGVLFANTITINFTATNSFKYNTGTAIYTNAGGVNVLSNSHILFEGNYGVQGGAIALIGFSALRTHPGANLTFVDNVATDKGGAIYFSSTDITDFMYTRTCFLRYSNITEHPDNWTASFNFVNNFAGQYGHSIYADTILPCARAASTTDYHRVFHWKPFYYSDPNRKDNIATAPAGISLGHNYTTEGIRVSPGEVFNLYPSGIDNLNNLVMSVYRASVSGANSSEVEIDSSYTYVSDGNTRVTGEVGAAFNLTFRTLDLYPVATSVNVTFTHCPPGFVPSKEKSQLECICSASTTNQQYEGITECDYENFTSLLSQSYWAGCTEDGEFLTGSCPLGYCHYFTNTEPFVRLNKTCEDLDEFLCGSRDRTDLLCGACKDGFSVHYHSQLYKCGKCTDRDTKVGWLLYVVSELVPLVIIFVLIMVLNINLTSGDANSFILFAQVLSFFQVNVFGTFSLPPGVDFLTQVYHFLFGLVNLSFFEFDSLSFCLWKGATVLDIMVFKYVTTAFSLFLLFLLVLLFNFFTCDRCCKLSRKDSYIIHGVSAFLVISYAQCAKISFEILTQFDLMGEGPSPKKSVVFLSGNIEFFSSEHLPYAIPAILVLLFFCALPPLVLIAYPASNKIPWRENWPRLPFRWFRRHVFDLNTLKPLLDSFQGCFKDDYRFFAGLYFLYRIAIAAEFAFTTSPIEFYVCLEVIIIIMLAFHAIAHPYKKQQHNVVDTLMFADLAIVNAISLYTYFWADYQSNSTSEITTAATIQLILIYLPIFYIAGVIVMTITPRHLVSRIVNKCKGNYQHLQHNEDNLPALRSPSPNEEDDQRQHGEV